MRNVLILVTDKPRYNTSGDIDTKYAERLLDPHLRTPTRSLVHGGWLLEDQTVKLIQLLQPRLLGLIQPTTTHTAVVKLIIETLGKGFGSVYTMPVQKLQNKQAFRPQGEGLHVALNSTGHIAGLFYATKHNSSIRDYTIGGLWGGYFTSNLELRRAVAKALNRVDGEGEPSNTLDLASLSEDYDDLKYTAETSYRAKRMDWAFMGDVKESMLRQDHGPKLAVADTGYAGPMVAQATHPQGSAKDFVLPYGVVVGKQLYTADNWKALHPKDLKNWEAAVFDLLGTLPSDHIAVAVSANT